MCNDFECWLERYLYTLRMTDHAKKIRDMADAAIREAENQAARDAANRPEFPTNRVFEYRTETIDSLCTDNGPNSKTSLDIGMNLLGKEGWELVTSTKIGPNGVLIFKKSHME